MGNRSLMMANPEVPSPFRRLFFLVGKIALLIFFTMAAGWGYGLALLKAHVFLDIVHRIAVLLMASVLSGLMSRYILQAQHGRLLAWLASFVAMTVSLADLYNLSGGLIGAHVFAYAEHVVNWEAAWQLVAGSLVILMALTAWWKPAGLSQPEFNQSAPLGDYDLEIAEAPRERIVRKNAGAKPRQTRRSQVEVRSEPGSSAPLPARAKTKKQPAESSSPRPSSRQTSVASAPLAVVKFHHAPRAFIQKTSPASRRQLKSRRSNIRLVGREEHRCPYCLCNVSPRDPDGVVICPVCHTYHHKACWDVTGACQVPHIHA